MGTLSVTTKPTVAPTLVGAPTSGIKYQGIYTCKVQANEATLTGAWLRHVPGNTRVFTRVKYRRMKPR